MCAQLRHENLAHFVLLLLFFFLLFDKKITSLNVSTCHETKLESGEKNIYTVVLKMGMLSDRKYVNVTIGFPTLPFTA